MPEKCYVLKDYRKYRYNPLELIFYSGIGALAMGTVGWVFYQNYYITVITAILGLFYPKIKLKKLSDHSPLFHNMSQVRFLQESQLIEVVSRKVKDRSQQHVFLFSVQ
jgi:hypothetical protein